MYTYVHVHTYAHARACLNIYDISCGKADVKLR